VRKAEKLNSLPLEIEEVAQRGFSPPLLSTRIRIMRIVMVIIVVERTIPGEIGRGSFLENRSLNNFIEFSAIKPDPPTGRTIIDLNTTSIGDEKITAINWTFHR
jgi:hypothetical protein